MYFRSVCQKIFHIELLQVGRRITWVIAFINRKLQRVDSYKKLQFPVSWTCFLETFRIKFSRMLWGWMFQGLSFQDLLTFLKAVLHLWQELISILTWQKYLDKVSQDTSIPFFYVFYSLLFFLKNLCKCVYQMYGLKTLYKYALFLPRFVSILTLCLWRPNSV